jgi:hypothetical protein
MLEALRGSRCATRTLLCLLVLGVSGLLPAAAAPATAQSRPPALFVGGRFGDARVLALDRDGRTQAFGYGRGVTKLLSPCPGGRRLAEIAGVDRGSDPDIELAIRETGSLRVVRRHVLNLPGWRFTQSLLCEDSAGSSVVIFAGRRSSSPFSAAIYRLSGRRLRTVWNGTAFLSSLVQRVAYLNSGAKLVSVDLRTGRTTPIVWLPRSPSLVPDARGTSLAGVAYHLFQRSRLVVVDLTTRPATVRRSRLAAAKVVGDVFWLPGRRLLFLPWYGRDSARVLDRALRTRARFPWLAGNAALVGSTVFGVHRENRTLLAADLPTGPMRVVQRLGGQPEVIVSATR